MMMADVQQEQWRTVYAKSGPELKVTTETFQLVLTKWIENPENVWRGITKAVVAPNLSEAPQLVKRRIYTNRYVAAPMYPREGIEDMEANEQLYLDEEIDVSEKESRVVFAPVLNPEVTLQRKCLPLFYPKAKKFAYKFDGNTLSFEVVPLDDETGEEFIKKLEFFGEKILTKFNSWAEKVKEYKKRCPHDVVIPKKKYAAMYKAMKARYGDWTEKWAQRNKTDKYVHEDIGIASYFCCLCEEERELTKITKDQQTFVDLGCGNGFLVHILTSEGYKGYGIDLNERPIWGLYDRTKVNLKAFPFDPSKASFPESHYILGNHADELTPWIPVIAARSGYKTRFISLPCCFWDFDGKFVPSDSKIGKYKTYLQYLEKISATCGYKVQEDFMRIPSTKNVALVALERSFPEGDEEAQRTVYAQMEKMLAKVKPFQPRPLSAGDGHGNYKRTHDEVEKEPDPKSCDDEEIKKSKMN